MRRHHREGKESGGEVQKPERTYKTETEREGDETEGGGVVLTLISLRMTSIMLPITMRKSNTFQGSLKYPYTG